MKVNISKSKNYEYLYIKRSFRNQEGKCTTENYKNLGRMDKLMKELGMDRDGVLAWADAQAEEETRKYNEKNKTIYIAFDPNKLIEKHPIGERTSESDDLLTILKRNGCVIEEK